MLGFVVGMGMLMLDGICVLVVDDNFELFGVIVLMLECYGVEVVIVFSGVVVFDVLEQVVVNVYLFDVLVSDFVMLGMDGMQLVWVVCECGLIELFVIVVMVFVDLICLKVVKEVGYQFVIIKLIFLGELGYVFVVNVYCKIGLEMLV